MRISDWSSDVCSSDLDRRNRRDGGDLRVGRAADAIGAGGGHRARLYFGLNRQFHPPFAPELVEGLSFTSAAKGRTVLRQAQHERKKGMALVVLAAMLAPAAAQEIGRASCRERVCQYG